MRENAVNAEIAGNAGLSDEAQGVSDDTAKSENDQSLITDHFSPGKRVGPPSWIPRLTLGLVRELFRAL